MPREVWQRRRTRGRASHDEDRQRRGGEEARRPADRAESSRAPIGGVRSDRARAQQNPREARPSRCRARDPKSAAQRSSTRPPDEATGLGDAPLHGADRHAEHRGDLVVRMLAGRGEQQRVSQLRCERRDLLAHAHATRSVATVARSGSGVGYRPARRAGSSAPRARLDCVRFRQSSCVPALVEGLAPGDGQEPRAERRVAAEAAQLPPRDDEGLLRRVFGVFPRSERRQRRPENDALMHRDQIAERRRWLPVRAAATSANTSALSRLSCRFAAPGGSVKRSATATVTGSLDMRDAFGWVHGSGFTVHVHGFTVLSAFLVRGFEP